MKRHINGKTWNYCDSEGFWWLQDDDGTDSTVSVRRSNDNCNVWLLCDRETLLGTYDTMKEAMTHCPY